MTKTADVRKLASRTAFFVLLGLSFLCIQFLSGYTSDTHHSDKGTFYAFNYFRQYGLVYGRDIVFFYGPLAYLIEPMAGAARLLQGNLLILAIHVTLLALLWFLARRGGDYLRFIPILIALFMTNFPDTARELSLTLIGILFYLEAVTQKRSFAFVAPTLFAAFFMYVKLGIGLSLTMLFVIYLIFSRLIRKDPIWMTALRAGLYLAAFAALGFLCFRSFADFANGFRVSLHLVFGHSEATAIPGKAGEVYAAVFMMPLLLLPAKWIKDTHGKRAALFWLCLASAGVFTSFKHSFVHQDWHIEYFFTVFPAVIASSLYFLPLRKVGLAVLIAFILASQGTSGQSGPLNPLAHIAAVNTEGIESLVNPGQAEEDAVRTNEKNLAADTLTEKEIQTIGQGSVDVLPLDAFLIGNHKVRWQPNPLVQFYYVFTRDMDRWLETYYAGDGAPDFIVMRWQDVDGRHPLFSAPAAYREIMSRYEFVSAEANGELLLRKGPPRRPGMRLLKSSDGRWNEALEIPVSDKIVVAEIRVRPALLSSVTRLFFRAAPALIELKAAGDKEGDVFRFTPGLAGDGLMVSRGPMGIEEMGYVIANKKPRTDSKKYDTLKIVAEGQGGYFRKKFTVDFYELDLTPGP